MNRFLQRYGLLTLSLAVLFASGLAAGFRWGHLAAPPEHDPAARTGTVETTPEQWGENAAAALQRDLGLTDTQTDQIRKSIAGPSRGIFEERHRANLKIHLRLLEAHDTLARDVPLTDNQKALLKRRKEELRKMILEKFRDLLQDNPDPVLSHL